MIQGVAVGELGDLGHRMCALGLRMERGRLTLISIGKGNKGKRRQAAGAGSPMREPRKSWACSTRRELGRPGRLPCKRKTEGGSVRLRMARPSRGRWVGMVLRGA
jgi:hypothetical protein